MGFMAVLTQCHELERCTGIAKVFNCDDEFFALILFLHSSVPVYEKHISSFRNM